MPEPQTSLPLYDGDASLRFAMRWSGLDEATVRMAQVAGFRYLQLAGLVEDEEDADLLRERAAYAHLLPDAPGVLDERATAYVVEVTGLGPDVVQRIEAAEVAYLESLGLLEGEADLAPDLAPGLEPGGHGDHWACLITDLGALFPGLAGPPVAAEVRLVVPGLGSLWPELSVSARTEASELEVWRVDGWRPEDSRLLAAFPVVLEGTRHTLTLGAARLREPGFEAVVPATTAHGDLLAYFDVAHLHPWNEWLPGEAVPIHLAALAYRLGPDRGEREAPGLVPVAGGTCDEFAFRGQIQSVARVSAWGQELHRLTLSLAPTAPGRPALELPLLVAPHRLTPAYRPRPGDAVAGVLWLQGQPEGLAYPVLCGE